MKKLCKLSANVFGYIETKTQPVLISSGTEYELKKINDKKYGVYYEVYKDDKLIATLSEKEVEIFFEN